MIDSSKSFDKKKKYLITNFQKIKYPKHSELVFIDETLFNFYKSEHISNYNCSYVNSVEDVIKYFDINNIIIKKKLPIYRKELTKILNTYSKINNSEKYWGLIIDNFLVWLLRSLIQQVKLFQKITIKDLNITSEVIKEKNFLATNDFIRYAHSNDFRKLLCCLILKELDHKSINFKFISSNKINNQNRTKIYEFILILIIRLYVYFFKPILIINGYLGLKNTVNFFLRSFGKIVHIPYNFFFSEANNHLFIDRNFRKIIKVHEKDLIDKIFNKVIGKILPVNYLENFNLIKNNSINLSKKIKIIGTGGCHYFSDYFNILTAEIINNKKGKLIIFQHGGCVSKTNQLVIEHMDQKYASRRYYFDNRRGLGMHFFNEKKISFEEIKKRSSILILTSTAPEEFYYNPLYHTINDVSLIFFSNLNKTSKKKVFIKLISSKNSCRDKKLWEKTFGNNLKILPIFSNAKKNRYYKAKLVILNDLSTPLWELLYFELPFILICSKKFLISFQYNDLFKKKFIFLKKINIWFDDPIKAAHFVNSLNKDQLIEGWWKKVSKTKIFLDFKNFLIVEKNNYHFKIIKDLKNLSE